MTVLQSCYAVALFICHFYQETALNIMPSPFPLPAKKPSPFPSYTFTPPLSHPCSPPSLCLLPPQPGFYWQHRSRLSIYNLYILLFILICFVLNFGSKKATIESTSAVSIGRHLSPRNLSDLALLRRVRIASPYHISIQRSIIEMSWLWTENIPCILNNLF